MVLVLLFGGNGLLRKLQTTKMKKQTLLTSFANAFNGLASFFTNDRNGKIHFTAVLLVSIAGFYFKASIQEWVVLLLCFGGVISIEMCNHAIEKLCDMVHPDQHPIIKKIKDVTAAAVLWSAIMSLIIGLLIFIPKISIRL